MKSIVYPVVAFVVLQLAVLTSITLWVIWYVLGKNRYEQVVGIARTAYASIETTRTGYAAMVGGLILLVIILVGATLLFVGWIRERGVHRQRATFFSGFTHELMTPITCIQMNLETIQTKKLDRTKQERLLSSAYKESKRLQATIHNILEMTRIEHKRKTIQRVRTDWRLFLERYQERSRELYPEIEWHFHCPPAGEAFSDLDEQAFTIVLNNLLDNAMKHAEKPQLSLDLGPIGKRWSLVFADNGPGIDEHIKKKVFQIFFRGSYHRPGSGLGLFIAKSIVTLHHGTMSLDPEGNGARFRMTLPRSS